VLLPFVNGLMLGFGELVANEAAFRLGWGGTKVCCAGGSRGGEEYMGANICEQIFPSSRSDARRVGPGVEMRADPVERRRRNGQELDMYTSLE